MKPRALVLRKDTLADLTPAELAAVGGAEVASTPTLTCTAILTVTYTYVTTIVTSWPTGE